MKIKKIVIVGLIGCFSILQVTGEKIDLSFFDSDRNAIASRLQPIPSGDNKPTGWLNEIMTNDLERGFVGSLGELYPGIQFDDIYDRNRRGKNMIVPEMGDMKLDGVPAEMSRMWWNAETKGNWWDGFIRNAFLTENEEAMERSHRIVEGLLKSQDDNGYIGIYNPSVRYQHSSTNGELWSQTTAIRSLLGYYELTGESAVLEAVERAVKLTMEAYGPEGRNPFKLNDAQGGGSTHGLMFTDVCNTLYIITGESGYQEYATFLYRSFSENPVNANHSDIRYPSLANRNQKFVGHAAHTYEHLRSLLQCYHWTGYAQLKTAWENALYKLQFAILPSGAGHGAEWLEGIEADPNDTATEFCAMFELRNSMAFASMLTGSADFADHVELLTFNGMMGFRNEEGTGITYAKLDNCSVLNSHEHTQSGKEEDKRYKYSPTHSDVAVCCAPNYGRNFPYYLKYMWLKNRDGLTAMLYGPSRLKTDLGSETIEIDQATQYPLSDEILMRISVSAPLSTHIHLRKPDWCEEMHVESKGAEIREGLDFIKVSKEWNTGDIITIQFQHKVMTKRFRNGDYYFQRGPIVYAKAIPHTESSIKEYPVSSFKDYHCFPAAHSFKDLRFDPEVSQGFEFRKKRLSAKGWYSDAPKLEVKLRNNSTGSIESVALTPIGNTVLRTVTFKPVSDEVN